MDSNKYQIERRYINKRPNVRPGIRLVTGSPAFLVAHDTGNPGASAENHFSYFNTQTDRSASAQVFIDDKRILEILPAGTGPDPAEQAFHVIRNVTTDNELFGYDANHAALGIELCYGGTINFAAAYARLVWYFAMCCTKWNKTPSTHIVSHKQLDPARKSDIDQALATGGKTLGDLIRDVTTEMTIQVRPVPAAAKLPADVCDHVIISYIQPARHAALQQGLSEEAGHFERLAANVRAAAAGSGLPKSNAQEIIYNWLSPAWHKAKAGGRDPGRYNQMANALRTCAGIPLE
ncbi:N-acetylmuramoyl-L-alanine amidase [Paenibacillus sp. RUD330]|uniref:peptidoglycan recognition protein family protein n=1 Tax=Paenibacillus sp. RUD330 TaxID=2023772 RepID=UPI000B929C41|nr:N-acetylmuramoyl-L-alanine amidase [Paenibacillus sp. RUD330]ASS66537.1 N-acetylmuramoyl-L-alanine amidase [Paenibacillus sp. RUD330]